MQELDVYFVDNEGDKMRLCALNKDSFLQAKTKELLVGRETQPSVDKPEGQKKHKPIKPVRTSQKCDN